MTSISLKSFNALPINQKAEIVWDNAFFFGERIEYGKYIWKFYLLGNLPIEVKYAVKSNQLIDIQAMKSVSDNNE